MPTTALGACHAKKAAVTVKARINKFFAIVTFPQARQTSRQSTDRRRALSRIMVSKALRRGISVLV